MRERGKATGKPRRPEPKGGIKGRKEAEQGGKEPEPKRPCLLRLPKGGGLPRRWE